MATTSAGEASTSASGAGQMNSDEVNYLIYRYMHEGGYAHSAYVFANETRLFDAAAQLDTADVPAAALIQMLHRGVQYAEAELVATTQNGEIAENERWAGVWKTYGHAADSIRFRCSTPYSRAARQFKMRRPRRHATRKRSTIIWGKAARR